MIGAKGHAGAGALANATAAERMMRETKKNPPQILIVCFNYDCLVCVGTRERYFVGYVVVDFRKLHNLSAIWFAVATFINL